MEGSITFGTRGVEAGGPAPYRSDDVDPVFEAPVVMRLAWKGGAGYVLSPDFARVAQR